MRDLALAHFSIDGRTSRGAFLKRGLKLCYLCAFLLVAGVFLASQGIRLAGYAAAALIVLLLIANYFLVVRRLHDRGRSGWWLLALLGTNVCLHFVEGIGRSHSDTFILIVLALLILNVWLLIELFFRRGTAGANRFGEDPLGASA